MKLFRLALIALAALVLAVPAGASDACTSTTAEVDTGDTPAGRYYVDTNSCHWCIFSIWVYQESNGVEGMQRQDEAKDDTDGGRCHPGDTIIF